MHASSETVTSVARVLALSVPLLLGCTKRGDPPGSGLDAGKRQVAIESSVRAGLTALDAGAARSLVTRGTTDDNLPFSPSGLRGASTAWRTWIYTDVGPRRTRFGYLRVGSIVDLRGPPIVNEGCAEGWYRINPRGFICIGKGAFSAFNHPINLIVHQVGPAIAAGCPVIVKPADDTPLSCYELVSIFREAGLPDAWCQALNTVDHEVAGRLAADPRVAFFSFIGSARVGWMLRSRLAPGARCALEHGGIAPVVVAGDADLDHAVPLLAKAGFYHAGQVCISVQRVYAHRSVARGLAERLAAAGEAMRVGDPTREETDIGPLIRPPEVERVHQWVTEAIDAGAERLCGGNPVAGNGYRPTVLLDPPEDVRVSCDEVFGPVICVYSYDHLDEALARANAPDFVFQAAVFTRDLDTAMAAYRGLAASAVMINDHTAFRVDWMPFAGLRRSGLGVGGIPYTFADMRVCKLMVIRSERL